MFGLGTETGWQFSYIELVFIAAAISFGIWRRWARRRSLHRRKDGIYVWTEWHGGERCSPQDPSEPGGAWDSEGDGDGGGGD